MKKMKKTLLILILSSVINSCNSRKNNNWEIYKKNVNELFNSGEIQLNKGTSIEKLNEFERKFSIKLTEDFKELYLKNNGEKQGSNFIVGLRFLSLEEIESEMILLKKITEQYNDFSGKTIPENSVKKVYYNEKWVPFIADSQGAYLALDLSSDSTGTKGQIINIGNDENDHFIIASNINNLFSMINILITEKGLNKQNVSHLTDELKGEIIKGYFKPTNYKVEIKKSK